MKVEFGAVASIELRAAAFEYESQRTGRGERFIEAVTSASRQLGDFSDSGEAVRGVRAGLGLRRLRVQRFPYYLVYRLDPEPIVVAVAHQRQAPDYFIARL